MIRRPLRSIPFPYTTLFRSTLMSTPASAQQHEVMTRANVEYVEHDGVKLSGDLYLPKGVAKAPVVIAIHGGGWQGGSPAGDRKSTRLNSSHLGISYAVFCLK